MSDQEPNLASRFGVWRNGVQGPYAQFTLHDIEFNTRMFDQLEEMNIIAPWRFTPRRAGYYLLTTSARWGLGVGEYSIIRIVVNGVLAIAQGCSYEGALAPNIPKATAIYYLRPTDWVTVDTYFDFAGVAPARFLAGTIEQTNFYAHRLS